MEKMAELVYALCTVFMGTLILVLFIIFPKLNRNLWVAAVIVLVLVTIAYLLRYPIEAMFGVSLEEW